MTAESIKTTILLISKNQSIIESTRLTLAEEEHLELVQTDVTPGNLFSVIEENRPNVILLDFNFQSTVFNLMDRIVSEYPKTALVAVISETEKVDLDLVILSGARAFVQYPYQPGKLVVTIKRVVELRERNHITSAGEPQAEPEIKPKFVATVFSPKGGAGTTTIATNLAISLQKQLDEDVLLIDGKHLFGHVALYLNLRTANSITDLIPHVGMLDQRLLDQVIIKHASGIHVLPGPNSISTAQGIKPEDQFKVLQRLQEVFPNIIIDGGNHLDENTVTYLDSSDKILLVLNPDLASMRDVRQFLEIASTLSYPEEKILLILNMAGRRADVKLREIEDILKMDVFGKIPADEEIALSSLNEGIPILMKKPRHAISRAYKQITKELVKIMQSAQED